MSKPSFFAPGYVRNVCVLWPQYSCALNVSRGLHPAAPDPSVPLAIVGVGIRRQGPALFPHPGIDRRRRYDRRRGLQRNWSVLSQLSQTAAYGSIYVCAIGGYSTQMKS